MKRCSETGEKMYNESERRALTEYENFKYDMAGLKARVCNDVENTLNKYARVNPVDIECISDAIDEAAYDSESSLKDILDDLGVCYD